MTKEKGKAKFHLRSKVKMKWTNDTRTGSAPLVLSIQERLTKCPETQLLS